MESVTKIMETSESKKIDIIKNRKNMQVIGLVNSDEETIEVLETMKLFQYMDQIRSLAKGA